MRALHDALWRIGLRGAYRVLRVYWWLRSPEVHGAYVAVWQGDGAAPRMGANLG